MSNYNFENPEETNVNQLLESFRTAKEMLENKENKDKPLQLLRKALDAIRIIDHSDIKNVKATELLNKIESHVKKYYGIS